MSSRLAGVVNRLARRHTSRRSFLARTAVAGSALATVPGQWILRPNTAYAAVCNCQGQSCQCGSLCCDGYTDFCCTIYGRNDCPPGSVVAGWWRAEGSGFCDVNGQGRPRYYLDCNASCGPCGCGSSGVCGPECGQCAGEAGCAHRRCDHRKTCRTRFRYGQCNNDVPCVGPIICRVVTCTPPWTITKFDCDATDAVDNFTRFHNRPCLQLSDPTDARPTEPFEGMLLVGDWNGDGQSNLGFVDADMRWHLRNRFDPGEPNVSFRFGRPGDIPIVGDWTGEGRDLPGVIRGNTWYLKRSFSGGAADITFSYGRPGDVPVVGDWNGSGRSYPGVVRDGREWLLRPSLSGGPATISFTYGREGDVPVVGDWDGDGVDEPGIVRDGRKVYLRDRLSSGPATIAYEYGAAGDDLVFGDWTRRGIDSVAAVRRDEHHWFFRDRNSSGAADRVWFFPPYEPTDPEPAAPQGDGGTDDSDDGGILPLLGGGA